MVRRRTRIARIGVRRERAGGASGAALARAATRAAWRRRARSRGPSGRPAVRAEPRPVRRAAGLAARAGGYCFIYDVCPRGQRSSGIRTRYTSVFTDCSNQMSFRTGGRPGNRTRAYASSAPICLRLSMAACAAATNEVRRRRTSRAREPWLAGQRDIRPEIHSEERASARGGGRKNFQGIEWKGKFFIWRGSGRVLRRQRYPEILIRFDRVL